MLPSPERPPIVLLLAELRTTIPSKLFGIAVIPSAAVPILLPCTLFPVALTALMRTPFVPFPENYIAGSWHRTAHGAIVRFVYCYAAASVAKIICPGNISSNEIPLYQIARSQGNKLNTNASVCRDDVASSCSCSPNGAVSDVVDSTKHLNAVALVS